MHILLPCKGIEYGDTRPVAEEVCKMIHERVPSVSTISSPAGNRGGKVYIDPGQNDYGDRLVAPYCVRAYKQPYVSMPLSWNQIDMQLDRHSFNIHAVKKTIETAANPWEGMLHDQIRKANTKVLKSLLNWLK